MEEKEEEYKEEKDEENELQAEEEEVGRREGYIGRWIPSYDQSTATQNHKRYPSK